jgi:hypothetical protein
LKCSEVPYLVKYFGHGIPNNGRKYCFVKDYNLDLIQMETNLLPHSTDVFMDACSH